MTPPGSAMVRSVIVSVVAFRVRSGVSPAPVKLYCCWPGTTALPLPVPVPVALRHTIRSVASRR